MEDSKEPTNTNRTSKPLWANPWQYRESVIIVLFVIAGGVTLEILSRGHHVKPVAMPYNVLLATTYVLSMLFFYMRFRKSLFLQWATSIPAAISAITLLSLLVLLMGALPQDVAYTSVIINVAGLNHIKVSWLFLATQLFFLTILFMVMLRRLFPINIRNLAFFLNHCGVFVILSTAIAGRGDIKTLNINLLKEGSESNIGVSELGDVEKLPFSLQLLDFYMEEYSPRLGVLDSHSHRLVDDPNKSYPIAKKGLKTDLFKWKIEVKDYLPNAVLVDSAILRSDENGNTQAASVLAINLVKRDTVSGWVMAGSYAQNPLYLALDTNSSLTLIKPDPKKYRSTIVVRTDSTRTDTISLDMNKPYTVDGWKIYQIGYDKSKGKWSSLSILKAVSDPWLPLVYAGFIMTIVGAVSLFWTVRKRH